MYILMYDYVNEDDICMGIIERYDTLFEAQSAKVDLKKYLNYDNFAIFSEGEE